MYEYSTQTYVPSSTSGANNTQTTISSTMGASVYCRFFASPLTHGAESFSYYRSMPCIDSTKNIRHKTASGNGRFAIFSTKSYIRRYFCLPLCRMFEPRCDSNILKGGKRKEAIDRTISAMTGISDMVEIVLR
jgi:hypothetical protein